MLGVSLPGYDLELSTDVLYYYLQDTQMKWPGTGWNEYYDTGDRKYADILTAKKRAPTPFKPGKCRQTDPKKIYTSEQELRERYLYHAESGK